MTFAPKLLALDVDGTLVDWDNQMSGAVRSSVRRAADAGAHVVVSTGRSVPGVLDAVTKLGLAAGLAVASNGSVVFAYTPDEPVEVLHTVTFDAREALRQLLAYVPDAAVAVEEVGRGYRINKPFPAGEIHGEMQLQDVEQLVAEPVTRVIVRCPDATAEDFAELVEAVGLRGTNYFVGHTAWLDLAPEGVTKASGLEVVCERLGVDRADVLALGDGTNDLEMLAWAGRGVAMGDASLPVVEAADDQTGSVYEDGVATELARWF